MMAKENEFKVSGRVLYLRDGDMNAGPGQQCILDRDDLACFVAKTLVVGEQFKWSDSFVYAPGALAIRGYRAVIAASFGKELRQKLFEAGIIAIGLGGLDVALLLASQWMFCEIFQRDIFVNIRFWPDREMSATLYGCQIQILAEEARMLDATIVTA